jgi:anti-sigma regulatory factor (Ser/Thr protein kinase)
VIVSAEWPAEPRSVTAARRFATDALRGVPAECAEDIELMISELVTNAVAHAGTTLALRIEASDNMVRVQVTDRQPGSVGPLEPGPTEPRGRGLQIVNALADRWGVEPAPDGGKTVWFVRTISSE